MDEYMETRSLDESCQFCSFEYPQIPRTKYIRTSFVANFECEKCEFSTTQKTTLQKHTKNEHGWLDGWLFNWFIKMWIKPTYWNSFSSWKGLFICQGLAVSQLSVNIKPFPNSPTAHSPLLCLPLHCTAALHSDTQHIAVQHSLICNINVQFYHF